MRRPGCVYICLSCTSLGGGGGEFAGELKRGEQQAGLRYVTRLLKSLRKTAAAAAPWGNTGLSTTERHRRLRPAARTTCVAVHSGSKLTRSPRTLSNSVCVYSIYRRRTEFRY